jgi:hypothetical protein
MCATLYYYYFYPDKQSGPVFDNRNLLLCMYISRTILKYFKTIVPKLHYFLISYLTRLTHKKIDVIVNPKDKHFSEILKKENPKLLNTSYIQISNKRDLEVKKLFWIIKFWWYDESLILKLPRDQKYLKPKYFWMSTNWESTPSYSNKHNVSLQYIVQFSKLLLKIWSIFTNCFWVKIFKTLNFPNLSGNFDTKFKLKLLNT